nr:unnamed protein product [Digitaria exilis]
MVSMKEMGCLDTERQPPAWFLPSAPGDELLRAVPQAPGHDLRPLDKESRTTGCNYFCADCAGDALCSGSCPADHAGHWLIQLR